MTMQTEPREPIAGERYEPETPFLQTFVFEQEPEQRLSWEASPPRVETPFLTLYAGETPVSLEGQRLHDLLTDLFDSDFEDSIGELVQEAAAQYAEHSLHADAETGGALAERLLTEWIEPLQRETERVIDEVARGVGQQDLYALTEDEVDSLLERFSPERAASAMPEFASPAFEEFLGRIFSKVTNVVKGAWNLAKKGIAAVGRILPIGAILDRIKGLIRPLLQRVLQFAMNRIPAPLRPLASQLARRVLGETPVGEEEVDGEAVPEISFIQGEFDVRAATLMLAGDDNEQQLIMMEVSSEAARPAEQIATDIDAARARFITEFGQLRQGESAAPAIQQFLPAVMAALPFVRMAITIIGRQNVVNFLAGHLAKLIEPHIGADQARALSRAIVDAGMGLLTLEEPGEASNQLAAEAVAATIEDTTRKLFEAGSEVFEDMSRLEGSTTQAFYESVAANFPPSTLRRDLPELEAAGVNATWRMMPRPRYRYKKYSRVFDVTITPQMARAITTFGGATLEAFLRDQLDARPPVRARVHLYEALPRTMLSQIVVLERRVPGLSQRGRAGRVQLHPLSPEAAGTLLQQPALGRQVDSRFLNSRDLITAGQRFFLLEIAGAFVRTVPPPPVTRRVRDGGGSVLPAPPPPAPSAVAAAVVPVRSSEVNLTFDLRRNEMRLCAFISERESQAIVPRLQARELTGAAQMINAVVSAGVNSALIGGMQRHVRIVQESATPEQLAPVAAAGAGAGAGILGTIGMEVLKWVVRKVLDLAWTALMEYLRHRADEFVTATRAPDDGVTICIVATNPALLLAFRLASQGRAPSLIELGRAALSAVTPPSVRVASGFAR